ncbi:hypothetical protein K457DRAFT_1879328 [Linnemannia elongata AG-77]|uniref:Uncharacterized protein n=1 Tax=Linnemannia elongata AG-77 TaxID=1314771 RepID=A0A197JKS2_9FUNG|nr:hypothetical protein K457DRAFT_1879328 [Linnemannia elongata AG-77]
MLSRDQVLVLKVRQQQKRNAPSSEPLVLYLERERSTVEVFEELSGTYCFYIHDKTYYSEASNDLRTHLRNSRLEQSEFSNMYLLLQQSPRLTLSLNSRLKLERSRRAMRRAYFVEVSTDPLTTPRLIDRRELETVVLQLVQQSRKRDYSSP